MARRLTLVVHSLASGGAERVLAGMANHWAARGEQVTLITLDAAANDECAVAAEVIRVGLDLTSDSGNLFQAIQSNVARVKALRRAIQASQPDHVISFTDKMNVLTLFACRGLSLDVVIAERTDPRHHRIGRIWSQLRKRAYPRCRALVVQTERVRNALRPLLHGKPIYVVPNAVAPPPATSAMSRGDSTPRSVVAVGRLVASKGFDLLIAAFARLAPKHPDWSLKILGKGPALGELEDLIRKLELTGRVQLEGWSSDPVRFLQGGDLFVMSSQYEGFPNALLEAMSVGLPVISFDCDSGPAEIIRHDVDGLLVPPGDVEQLARAMDRLMSSESERLRLGACAREVAERFSVERYFKRWDIVLRGGSESELSATAPGSA